MKTKTAKVRDLTLAEKEKLIRARAANVKDEHHDIWMFGKSIRELLDLRVIAFGCDNDFGEGVFKSVDEDKTLAFLEKYPQFAAGGYIRLDANPVLYFDTIALTTTEADVETDEVPLSLAEIVEFSNLFHHADEFEVGEDSAFAWFD